MIITSTCFVGRQIPYRIHTLKVFLINIIQQIYLSKSESASHSSKLWVIRSQMTNFLLMGNILGLTALYATQMMDYVDFKHARTYMHGVDYQFILGNLASDSSFLRVGARI